MDETDEDPSIVQAPVPPMVEKELTHGEVYDRHTGHSLYNVCLTTGDDGNPTHNQVVFVADQDSAEKVTLNVRFTYTEDSVLSTAPGRHLHYRAAESLMHEIFDSYLADIADLNINCTHQEFEDKIAATMNVIETRLRQLQSGERRMPILGFALGKRTSRRPSPTYTMVPLEPETTAEDVRKLYHETTHSPIDNAARSTIGRHIVHNRGDTYYQKNTVMFKSAISRSIKYAPSNTVAEPVKRGIQHRIKVMGTPPPPIAHSPSEASEIVSEGSGTTVLLEAASEASESLTEASSSWDLTVS